MTKPRFALIAATSAPLLLAAAIATVRPAVAQLPDGEGRDLVRTICTACHDLSPISGNALSREDWEMVVKNMVEMGARIQPEQIPVIVNYLATAFPPKTK